LLLAALLACVLMAGAVSADTWTDSGNFNASWYETYSSGNEFLIYDAGSLAAFSEKVSKNSSKFDFSEKTVKLMSDINLEGHNWTAIGTESNSFNGTFDGQYHTITNLVMPAEYDKGLFGYTNGATIQNVTVSNVTICIDGTSTSQSAGGLVGKAVGTTIKNSRVSGGKIETIQAWSICGGTVGTLNGASTIENCTSSGVTITINVVTNDQRVQSAGGFVGWMGKDAHVTRCSALDATIASQHELNGLGGFAGYCEGTIDNSTVTGTITGVGIDVGGFVGQERVNSKITDCYSNVQIQIDVPEALGSSGDVNIGGFVGTTKGSNLENCYAVGTITVTGTPNTNVGGFLGQIRADENTMTTMNSCVALVNSISATSAGNVSRFIGYVKEDSHPVTKAYAWDKLGYTDDSTISQGKSYNATGVSSAVFWGKQNFFSNTLGWTFERVWKMNSGNDNYQLPVLVWQITPVSGDGSYLKPEEPPAPPVPQPVSSSDGNMNNAFRVLFETNGGGFISPATDLSYGDRVAKPADPVKDGCTFAGWYTDAACTQGWSFSDSIPGDMTLYAKWTSSSSGTEATAAATTQPTAKATTAPAATQSQTAAATTAAPVTTTAAGVSPTLTQAPAPVFGALFGLLIAGVLLRRRA
nr:InlB B-repeat-containing protein [Methanocorpusculum sp.]